MPTAADKQTWIRLDSQNRWFSAQEGASLVVDGGTASGNLRLGGFSNGPIAINDKNESLGGLVLPRGFAQHPQGQLYLLCLELKKSHVPSKHFRNEEKHHIKRFDPSTLRFELLPHVGGSPLASSECDCVEPQPEARQFCNPQNIAATEHLLYVADRGNNATFGCVKVFDLRTLALLQELHECSGDKTDKDPTDIRPIDIAAFEDQVFILDGGEQPRVLAHQVGDPRLRLVLRADQLQTLQSDRINFKRIVVDAVGNIYVLLQLADRGQNWLLKKFQRIVRSNSQNPRVTYEPADETMTDSGELRSRFARPLVVLDHRGWFALTGLQGAPFSRGREGRLPSVSAPFGPYFLASGEQDRRAVYDRCGNLVTFEADEKRVDALSQSWPRPIYQQSGEWFSKPLDSKIYRCQWHRVEAEFDDLPAGTWAEISTHSSDEMFPRGPSIPEPLWDKVEAFVGRPAKDRSPFDRHPFSGELLIQSPPGRYLVIRIRLGSHAKPEQSSTQNEKRSAGGFATPLVNSLRVHYPRQSYLEYLPAVFSEDVESQRFLERFLSLFQREWDGLEKKLDCVHDWFAPASVPDDLVDYLAEWLGAPLEGSWTSDQKRRFLQSASKTFRKLGTPAGIREYVAAYLRNLSDFDTSDFASIDVGEQNGKKIRHAPTDARSTFPIVTECFRERQHAVLDPSDERKAFELPMWSYSAIGRFRFGAYDRIGEARLISVGDPGADMFRYYAHRFRVSVPAAWVRNPSDEFLIRRAITESKPAHTDFHLDLVSASMCVGVQCTVGVDTITAATPKVVLGVGAEAESSNGTTTMDAPVENLLGINTMISASPRSSGMQIDAHVGVHARLA